MKELNICLRCDHLSEDVYEDETFDIDDYHRIQCPKCYSSEYYLASEVEEFIHKLKLERK